MQVEKQTKLMRSLTEWRAPTAKLKIFGGNKFICLETQEKDRKDHKYHDS